MMFAGMIRVDNETITHKNDVKCYRCAVRSDGVTVESDSRHRRSFRRPGYMRAEPLVQLDAAVSLPSNSSCDSHKNSSIPNIDPSNTNTPTSISALPSSLGEKWLMEVFETSNSQTTSKTQESQVEETSRTVPSCGVFNSSFSFIQQSLETSDLLDTCEKSPSQNSNKRSETTSWEQSEPSSSDTLKSCPGLVNKSLFEDNSSIQSKIKPVPISQSEVFTLPCSIGQSIKSKSLLLDEELWLGNRSSWCHMETQISSSTMSDFKESVQDSDCGSLDTEVTSSVSVDSSDSTSASSVTSGYDSTTPSAHQSCNGPRKCEDVLQDCLQNNRANVKIKSMMLKLQRMQHRAVLDDDYDAAERFGQKLEDLRREQVSLKASLPSTHPAVVGNLQKLRTAVHSALQRTSSQCREKDEWSEDEKCSASSSGKHQRWENLIQQKQRIQKEMCDLQRRLEELQEQSRAVEVQLALEEQRLEEENPKRWRMENLEEEVLMLRGCDVTQLQLMDRVLDDIMSSEHRSQISASPPAEIIRLQEKEQALGLCIKETTAKVLMSQKLGSSLRRKVSETETQLLSLQEAKLAAISGNDFSSAKELKAEIRNVYSERDRLEALVRKLHTLSTGSGQELTRMKEQLNQIKLDLQRREAQHECSLKENIVKYIELLEEQHHSCGSSALENIWVADLEACHLLLKGLELRTSSLSKTESNSNVPPCAKEEADCAMLTALGGRWCPDTNLQHSEFTKKLEEFLFCVEDGPEDLCGDAVELTVRCDLISDRLHYLEEQLQTAMENHDKDLTLSLEKEVQEVKAMLHAMLSQLKLDDDDDGGDEDDEDNYCDVEEGQVDDADIEEELYFSDPWEI